VSTSDLNAYRIASPTFAALFDAVDADCRANRHARSEDTLHELANGDKRKVKTVTDADGATVTTDEGAIYDTKALALELAGSDPQRYGQAKTGASGVQVIINFGFDLPQVRQCVELRTVALEDADEVTT